MSYQVVKSMVWRHESGKTVSSHGALPWWGERPPGWELVQDGWTVYNPLTNQYGIGRPSWKTEAEASAFAQKHRPSAIGIGD